VRGPFFLLANSQSWVLEWFRSYLSGRTFRVIFSAWVYVVHYLHRLLSPAGVSAGSAVVHCVHSGPSRHSGEARCISILYTRLPTTHRCIFTVVAPIRRQLPLNWNDAWQMSATACQQTDSSSRRTRLSYSGSDRDTAFSSKAVVFQYYNSVPTLLQAATTSIYWL